MSLTSEPCSPCYPRPVARPVGDIVELMTCPECVWVLSTRLQLRRNEARIDCWTYLMNAATSYEYVTRPSGWCSGDAY